MFKLRTTVHKYVVLNKWGFVSANNGGVNRRWSGHRWRLRKNKRKGFGSRVVTVLDLGGERNHRHSPRQTFRVTHFWVCQKPYHSLTHHHFSCETFRNIIHFQVRSGGEDGEKQWKWFLGAAIWGWTREVMEGKETKHKFLEAAIGGRKRWRKWNEMKMVSAYSLTKRKWWWG